MKCFTHGAEACPSPSCREVTGEGPIARANRLEVELKAATKLVETCRMMLKNANRVVEDLGGQLADMRNERDRFKNAYQDALAWAHVFKTRCDELEPPRPLPKPRGNDT